MSPMHAKNEVAPSFAYFNFKSNFKSKSKDNVRDAWTPSFLVGMTLRLHDNAHEPKPIVSHVQHFV